MDKETLIEELNRLAEANETTNPIAASVLYTLSSLCLTDNEALIAISTNKINDHFLKQFQPKQDES